MIRQITVLGTGTMGRGIAYLAALSGFDAVMYDVEEGALDAWTEPIGMKKGRAAAKLCALVPAEDEGRFAALFLRETTTLGVRVTHHRRHEAPHGRQKDPRTRACRCEPEAGLV